MLKLILVDDDDSSRLTLSIALKTAGFKVDVAEDAEEALEKFRNNVYHTMITDVKMHETDGVELAHRVRGLYPKCKIILISAYDKTIRIVNADVEAFFQKPVDIKALCDAISKLS